MEELVVYLGGHGSFPAWIAAYLAVASLSFFVSRGRLARYRGRLLICSSLLFLALGFFILSFGVREVEAVGSSARIAPRLWAAGLALFTLEMLRLTLHERAPEDPKTGDVKKVLLTAGVVAFSLWGMDYAGYLVSSASMILLLLLLFGERRPLVLLSLAGGWTLFSWFVFVRVLMLSLPTGILFG